MFSCSTEVSKKQEEQSNELAVNNFSKTIRAKMTESMLLA
jgi:hypothetical protein